MTTNYMTGEQRAEQEARELAEAEAQFQGKPTDPEMTPKEPQDTPQEPENEPQEPSVDWEKRYKDLQSHSSKKEAEFRQKLQEAGVEPEETDKVAELEARLKDLQDKEDARELQTHLEQAQFAVGNAHPDYVSVINSAPFADWMKTQPQVYQDAIYSERPDAQLSIDALSLFKMQHGHFERQAQEQHQQLMDQAAMNVGGGHKEQPKVNEKRIWSWAEINRLSPNEYARYETEIDEALLEGRVQ